MNKITEAKKIVEMIQAGGCNDEIDARVWYLVKEWEALKDGN